MCAFELVQDRKTKEADKDISAIHVKKQINVDYYCLSAGTYGNVIRVLMPLVITDEQLEEGLTIIEAALEASVQQTVEV